ncbi:glucagon receptor isoform X4 [Camelus bactrianus]|uniref:Glucagon receptor isoform X4 n=1 Tax=Camelus bactrianus TaxID=9837 RepID=A0AC58NQM8_CAMBA
MGRGPRGRSLRGRSRRCPAQRRGWGPRQGLRGPESLPAARREDRGAQRGGRGTLGRRCPAGRPRPRPLRRRPRPASPPESLRGAGADPDPAAPRRRAAAGPGPERAEDGGERGAAARARDPASLPLSSPQRSVRTRGPPCPDGATPARRGRPLPRGMPRLQPRCPHLLLLLLLAWQVMDFLFEKWKLYGDQCLYNLSLLPPPTELVCNRTFDKYSCWPDTPPNTTANISCPWYLPWHRKAPLRLQEVWARWAVGARASGAAVAECLPVPGGRRGARSPEGGGPDVQQLPGDVHGGVLPLPGGPAPGPGRPAGPQVRPAPGARCPAPRGWGPQRAGLTRGPRSKLHCTRNYIHVNLFTSFVLKASSVLAIDALLKTRYSQRIGDDLSVSVWLSDGAVAGCRVAAVFMQYGVVANYCWLLVEGLYLHGLLGLAAAPGRSCFGLYLGIGWGAPMLFVIPWAVVKCLFENIQGVWGWGASRQEPALPCRCWTSNDNMAFWWILRFPVFLAILINFFIFIRILHVLVAKLRAHQMRYTDYKLRLAKSTLTLIPLLGVHEVVFAFVTDEHAQGTLRSTKLFFDLFLSSFQGLLVAVLYCFLNKEVQSELLRRWHRWREGKALHNERHMGGGHMAQPARGPPSQKLLLSRGGGSSNGTSQDPSAETCLAGGLPGLAESPF